MSGRRLTLAITQRVIVDAPTGERRDALSQGWATWLAGVRPDAILVPVPNGLTDLDAWLATVQPDAAILSGGGARGDHAKRDRVEDALLAGSLPLLGVCRGAHVINLHFGGSVQARAADPAVHVARTHPVHLAGDLLDWSGRATWEVNSFHDDLMTDSDVAPALNVVARAEDGSVEAVQHDDRPILGILWHPERATPMPELDAVILNRFLDSIPEVVPCAQ